MEIFLVPHSRHRFSNNEIFAEHRARQLIPDTAQKRQRSFSESRENFQQIRQKRMCQLRETIGAEKIGYIKNNLTHEYTDSRRGSDIWSSDPGSDSQFNNKYQPHQWTFLVNYRNPLSPYYASDVTCTQYDMMSNRLDFSGIYPRVIIRSHVTNTNTLEKTEGLTGKALSDAFFQTENGKSTLRILQCFRLTVRQVVRTGNDFFVYINPTTEFQP
ncbi:hypothetical protein ABE276_002383 [Salmonella enterica]